MKRHLIETALGFPQFLVVHDVAKRHDLAEEVVSTREPRRLPVVLSPEEVARLLAAARNIKHKALLSLAYATGLRASEVVSLKLTDIDSDRMVGADPVRWTVCRLGRLGFLEHLHLVGDWG